MTVPRFAFIAAALFFAAPAFAAESLPTRVGDCVATTITAVETRLQDDGTHEPVPGSGSAVRFANGGYQVSYDTVPEIEESKKGDKARMCLVSAPQDCPKGDERGKIYRTTNLRTKKSWKLPDSEHTCGGA
ncbi:hypothetical protein [Methylocystis bryophila]|uniref:Uncharacterized protein n=1 Tax=Methylocystis bryophila TaxID=655015 RepID=A0A1W6MWB9_9HYPH|nr:hypothetical protein [Methylocystis bryophila]ARN81893.1 hypothetical protein B1812_13270 [Methylocystis bryophila]BDV37977.1 hypothetical protein DSM21852_12300 [Methylocystis bryophila]